DLGAVAGDPRCCVHHSRPCRPRVRGRGPRAWRAHPEGVLQRRDLGLSALAGGLFFRGQVMCLWGTPSLVSQLQWMSSQDDGRGGHLPCSAFVGGNRIYVETPATEGQVEI